MNLKYDPFCFLWRLSSFTFIVSTLDSISHGRCIGCLLACLVAFDAGVEGAEIGVFYAPSFSLSAGSVKQFCIIMYVMSSTPICEDEESFSGLQCVHAGVLLEIEELPSSFADGVPFVESG